MWSSVASSADGTKLAAVVANGRIYTSSDSGETWAARESDRYWIDVASSADGSILVAADYGGQIYTSECEVSAPPADCSAPWGGTIDHGSSVTVYQSASVPYGSSCVSESRTCDDGALAGSYTHQSCTVDPPAGGTWQQVSMTCAIGVPPGGFQGDCPVSSQSPTYSPPSGDCSPLGAICHYNYGPTSPCSDFGRMVVYVLECQ